MGEPFQRRWERIVSLDKQNGRDIFYSNTQREKVGLCQKNGEILKHEKEH